MRNLFTTLHARENLLRILIKYSSLSLLGLYHYYVMDIINLFELGSNKIFNLRSASSANCTNFIYLLVSVCMKF